MIERIGIDIDGVIRDIHSQLLYIYKMEYPDKIVKPIEEWTTWNICKYFPTSEKDFKEFWFKTSAYDIYLSAKQINHSSFALLKLIKNVNVSLISAQPNINTCYFTSTWLANNSILFDELHYTQEKGSIPCDIYIDDSIDQYNKITNYHSNHRIRQPIFILINKPWNQDKSGSFIRCENLLQASEYIMNNFKLNRDIEYDFKQ